MSKSDIFFPTPFPTNNNPDIRTTILSGICIPKEVLKDTGN
jgi:hypothetical protein